MRSKLDNARSSHARAYTALAVWLFTASLVSTGKSEEFKAVTFDLPQLSEVFVLPPYDDALTLPVSIGGKEHLFVLDSGASVNAFHTDLQECLGKSIRKQSASGANREQVEVGVYRPPVAAVGSLSIARNAPVACVDLSPVRAVSGRDIQGILGIPFFVTNIIQIDFDHRELRILPLSTKPVKKWGQPIAVSFEKSSLPIIHARIADHANERCVVDTGFTGTLSLRSDVYVSLLKANSITPSTSIRTATLGKIGKTDIETGLLSEFEISGNIHSDLTVLRRDAENVKSTIGLNYLRRYLVTFDLRHARFYLAKGAEFDRSGEDESIGVGILRRNGKTVVEWVRPDGLAENFGFQIGDELTSIAGENVGVRPMAEISWMMHEEIDLNGRLEVGIRRNGEGQTLVVETGD